MSHTHRRPATRSALKRPVLAAYPLARYVLHYAAAILAAAVLGTILIWIVS